MKLLIRPLLFIAALPFGLLLSLYLFTLSVTLKKKEELFFHSPSNAIIYVSHRDVYLWASEYKLFLKPQTYIWIGYHGFLSYLWIPWQFVTGIPVYRFDPRSSRRPTEQIFSYIHDFPNHRIIIASDSGRPYGKVKRSLTKLVMETGRPAVAMKHVAYPSLNILGHTLPLPFATCESRSSRVISAEELRSTDRDPKEVLQEAIAKLDK